MSTPTQPVAATPPTQPARLPAELRDSALGIWLEHFRRYYFNDALADEAVAKFLDRWAPGGAWDARFEALGTGDQEEGCCCCLHVPGSLEVRPTPVGDQGAGDHRDEGEGEGTGIEEPDPASEQVS